MQFIFLPFPGDRCNIDNFSIQCFLRLTEQYADDVLIHVTLSSFRFRWMIDDNFQKSIYDLFSQIICTMQLTFTYI